MNTLKQRPDPKYINYAIAHIFSDWDTGTYDRLVEAVEKDADDLLGDDYLSMIYEGADLRFVLQEVQSLAKSFEECATCK